MNYVLGISLALSSSFLILLVLIQQGRGGGLAGAFGGMGGQSAFGTKAGDLFTKITIAVAAIWILLCVATVKYASTPDSPFGAGLGTQAPAAVTSSTDKTDTDKTGADKTDGEKTGTDKSATEKKPPASPPPKDSGAGDTSQTPAGTDK